MEILPQLSIIGVRETFRKGNEMTKKPADQPLTCDVELCCKATGELKLEVIKELEEPDKSLASLIEEREADEDKNSQKE